MVLWSFSGERRGCCFGYFQVRGVDGVPLSSGSGPQKALSGSIPGAVLEPLVRSWSHFVGIYRQKLTRCLAN